MVAALPTFPNFFAWPPPGCASSIFKLTGEPGRTPLYRVNCLLIDDICSVASALSYYGQPLHFVVPTGNLGNAFAAILARALGLPLGRIVLATNANDVLPAFFDGADYAPRASLATLANARDVGAPSNFERLRWLDPDDDELRRAFRAERVDDAAIRDVIARRYRDYGEVFCPHTACAVKVLEDLRRDGADGDWCVVSTAHPAKFESIVEPLIGRSVGVPPLLDALLQRPASARPLANDYLEFSRELRAR